MRRPDDPFQYELLIVQSFEDALIAILTNYNIQTVVIRFSFPYRSAQQVETLQRELMGVDQAAFEAVSPGDRGIMLCEVIGRLRPELCVYIVTDVSIEEMAGRTPPNCLRVFYQQEDFLELHLNILRGVNARYQTPFFTALKEYSRQPTGVFHAMPISRGKSITKSHWIQDMGQFYGMNIFLAETSATSGGLDSLLEPTGPIKKAQELAARAFGAQRTYFVTNGTSTANKIVHAGAGQARRHPPGRPRLPQVAPLRAGARRRAYGLSRQLPAPSLLDVRRGAAAGDQEAAAGVPQGRQARPGQGAAAHQLHLRRHRLQRAPRDGGMPRDQAGSRVLLGRGLVRVRALRRHLSPAHRDGDRGEPAAEVPEARSIARNMPSSRTSFDADDENAWLEKRLLPDPDKVRIRVYATHSTHKTLTSLRQGSMIHVHDQDFQHKVSDTFHEAYMTHTSTSPNYQILASLDVGRRQVELEGFELVKKQLEMAMVLREKVLTHPLLSRYFRFLTVKDMIPAEYRKSGIEAYYEPDKGWTDFFEAWRTDEFVLDPTRLTLAVGLTGVDGNTFKNAYLMDKYGIQINKTSRNTVLFMTNIGTTRSSVAYLIDVLARIADELDAARRGFQPGRAGDAGPPGPQPHPRSAGPAGFQPLPRPLPARSRRRHARGRHARRPSSSPTTRPAANTCRTRTTPSTG